MPTSNPYFNPCPLLYLTALKVLGVLGTVIGLFGLYVLLVKTPKKTTRTFRFLIMYHVILAVLFQLTITILAPPRVYLPYIAVDFPGIYTQLGIAPEIQLECLFSSIIAAVSCISPLCYYRMNHIIPKEHFLNKQLIRIVLYLFIYVLGPILPIVLLAMCVQDQKETKDYLVSLYGIEYDRFYSRQVLAFRFDLTNTWSIVVAVMFCLAVLLAISLIVICSVVIYRTFTRSTTGVSEKIISKSRRALRMSLVISILVLLIIVAVIIPLIGLLVMTNSKRADIMNVAIFLGSCAFPFAISAFYLTYAPYRRIIVDLLRRMIRLKRREPVGTGSTIWMTTAKRASFVSQNAKK